jgi:hypothetical protein
MSQEYITPAGYINETDTVQYLAPGGVYINETVEEEAAGGTTHHIHLLLMGQG